MSLAPTDKWLETIKLYAQKPIQTETVTTGEPYELNMNMEALLAPRNRLEHRLTPTGEQDFFHQPVTDPDTGKVTGYSNYIAATSPSGDAASYTRLDCELHFSEQDPISRPGRIDFRYNGDKSTLSPTFSAGCELHAAIIAGEAHLHNTLLPAMEMEAQFTEPSAQLKTGVIVHQYELEGTLWSVGVGADWAEGEASDPHVFITDGHGKYAEFGNIMVVQEDAFGEEIENMAAHREGVDDLPDAIRHNVGNRAAHTLCTLTATRQFVETGKNIEEPDGTRKSWAEDERARDEQRERNRGDGGIA